MTTVFEMTCALARLGNPKEANPVFSGKDSATYQNTLGSALSTVVFEAIYLNSFRDWLLSKMLSQKKIEIMMGSTFSKLEEHKLLRQIEEIVETLKVANFSKYVGSPEDKEMALLLQKKIVSGDKVAAAAVWFPVVVHWVHQGNDSNYLGMMMSIKILLKYLDFQSRVYSREMTMEEWRLLGEARLASFLRVDFDSLLPFDFGEKFEGKEVGWRARPSKDEITQTPYWERIQNWERFNSLYEKGKALAIKLILKYREVANGKMEPTSQFVVQNTDWLRQFVAEARNLPAMSEIWTIANKNSRNTTFSLDFKPFDGESYFRQIEDVIQMSVEMPEQYAVQAARAVNNLQLFLKNVYNLKD